MDIRDRRVVEATADSVGQPVPWHEKGDRPRRYGRGHIGLFALLRLLAGCDPLSRAIVRC